TTKWQFEATTEDNTAVIGSDGTIYVGAQSSEDYTTMPPGRMLAINPNGTLKWSFNLTQGIVNTNVPPALAPDGTLYFADGPEFSVPPISRSLYGVLPNGDLKWKRPLFHNILWAPPTVDALGNVYVCQLIGGCFGVDSDGNTLWHIDFGADDLG